VVDVVDVTGDVVVVVESETARQAGQLAAKGKSTAMVKVASASVAITAPPPSTSQAQSGQPLSPTLAVVAPLKLPSAQGFSVKPSSSRTRGPQKAHSSACVNSVRKRVATTGATASEMRSTSCSGAPL
jgi:hypothetical protein